jgi:hypothetical protein
MMHSGYRRSRKVVSTVAQIESDTKEDPKVDMGVVAWLWIWRRRYTPHMF